MPETFVLLEAALAAQLWGKSSQRSGLGHSYPLLWHLLDTGAAARVVCETLLSQPTRAALSEAAGSWDAWLAETVLLACWHDLGKATCSFQQQAPDCPDVLAGVEAPPEAPGRPDDANRHAWASGLLAWDVCAAETSDESAARRAALIVGGHHGVVPSYSWDELRRWGGERCLNDPTEAAEILSEARQSLVRAVAGANSSAGGMAPGSLPVYASALSLAVVVLADWVASSREFLIAQASTTAVEPAARVGQAQRLTAEHLVKLALVPPRPPRALLPAAQLLPSAAQPTSLQASIQDHHPVSAPGITIITAPTGEGKTEAALLAASRYATAAGTAGWYFAMPTMGTADGLHSRLERILPALVEGPAPPLHLLHSLRRLRGEPTGWDAADPQARRWMTSDRKAFLAPCAVGTVDQALMAVLRTKHSPLRMLAAVSGVLIIDEAHVFDPYTQRLLRRLLEWAAAAGASVVVMSATLPHDLAVSFFDAYRDGTRRTGTQPSDSATPKIDYPGWVAWTPEHGWSAPSSRCAALSPRTLTIRTRRTAATDLDTEISERALEASSDGGCVMIVRETVAKAQRTFELLDSIAPDRCETLLLHSRFRHDDRRDAAEDLLARLGPPPSRDRPDRLVLVATQIVELSLDVDFDLVLSDLAPMAALLQRSGRCHRHNRHSRPPAVQTPAVEVFIPVDSDGDVCRSAVYLTHDLRQSVSLLPDTGRVVSVPGDIADLVNGAHIDINDDSDDYQQWLAENDLKSSLAAAAVIPAPWRPAEKTLPDLTSTIDGDLAATRLGVQVVQVLPTYETPAGDSAWPAGPPLPEYPTNNEEQRLYGRCVPVPYTYQNAAWLSALQRHPNATTRTDRRSAWTSGPLSHALLLPVDATGNSSVDTDARGAWRVHVDARTGLTSAPAAS